MLVLTVLQSQGQATPWYYGGKADGHASIELNNFTPSTLAHQKIYAGSKGDGASMYEYNIFTPSTLSHQVAYAGSKGDGASMSDASNFTPSTISHFVAYFGGAGDGWSNELATGFPLPLVLLSFDGKAEKDHNALTWATSYEEKTDYFLLEKSRDATAFKSVAQVNAAGHSGAEKKYSYNDREDINGVNYYRLKMTDQDTKYTYSKVIRLVNEQLDYSITLSPNPANEQIRMSFSKALSQASRFVVYDMTGKVVISSVIEKDESVKNINISSLSSGKYMIQLNTLNENVNFPFIKQ
jgi:hypothetical protein